MEPLGGHVEVALKSPFLLFPCSYHQQRPLQEQYNNNKYTIIYIKWIQSRAWPREKRKRREINMAPTVAEGNHIPFASFLFLSLLLDCKELNFYLMKFRWKWTICLVYNNKKLINFIGNLLTLNFGPTSNILVKDSSPHSSTVATYPIY